MLIVIKKSKNKIKKCEQFCSVLVLFKQARSVSSRAVIGRGRFTVPCPLLLIKK
jgi:hypothetical protein